MISIIAQIVPLALSPNSRLACAILMGIVFGFVLIKGDFPIGKAIRANLTLKAGGICKSFLLSIALGTLLFAVLAERGIVNLHIRPAYFWPSLLGGLLAGLGVALCSRVPITAVASLAAGRIHAIWILLGMGFAIFCVNTASQWLSGTIFTWGSQLPEPQRSPELFSFANPVVWILIFAGAAILLLQFALKDGTEKPDSEK
ncbi:MAG: YeeE/YedE thiosulfate transporter family protein [Victivallaceae bacterium]|nr:YeeE/YedE thiosulfate transporter family protein [Victivallaceae bacterium]